MIILDMFNTSKQGAFSGRRCMLSGASMHKQIAKQSTIEKILSQRILHVYWYDNFRRLDVETPEGGSFNARVYDWLGMKPESAGR
jgi:hypothetical protein